MRARNWFVIALVVTAVAQADPGWVAAQDDLPRQGFGSGFLVDPKGVVRKVYPKVKPDGHDQEVLRDLVLPDDSTVAVIVRDEHAIAARPERQHPDRDRRGDGKGVQRPLDEDDALFDAHEVSLPDRRCPSWR